jgi:Flp pilus assembly protein TadD
MEEWEAATSAFQKAVELAPGEARNWALLGETQQQAGMDGYPALQKAWELSPQDEIVNGLLGIYYRRQGKQALAAHYLELALVANPNSVNWDIEMGNLFADEGDLERALSHYHTAIEKDRQNWTSWRALAVFCVKHNYQVETVGIPAVREALVLNPSSPALLDLMGTAYMMVNELDRAERFFIEAEANDPGQAAILIHLGQLYLVKNEKEKALDYFRQAAQFAQEDRLREMANRLLLENGGE